MRSDAVRSIRGQIVEESGQRRDQAAWIATPIPHGVRLRRVRRAKSNVRPLTMHNGGSKQHCNIWAATWARLASWSTTCIGSARTVL